VLLPGSLPSGPPGHCTPAAADTLPLWWHRGAVDSLDTWHGILLALFLAEGTVKNYVTNILGKLEVRDRTQAALKAQESDLI
jgi:hypothetical protein